MRRPFPTIGLTSSYAAGGEPVTACETPQTAVTWMVSVIVPLLPAKNWDVNPVVYG